MTASVVDEQPEIDVESDKSRCKKRDVGQFFRKYFLEGQKLDRGLQARFNADISSMKISRPWHERHRNLLAFFLPFAFFQLCWWPLAIRHNLFELYPIRYQMPVTMVFGAFVSGATSEGGGAVAFPVMTLLLRISPVVARDFSLMIQSCGMAASSFTILLMRIQIEWHSIVYSSLGACFSIIVSMQFLDDFLTGQEKKMVFVSVWFSFAGALLLLNMQHKRRIYDSIPNFCRWKALILLVAGFIGGILTALTGSGTDICSFCVLTLLFRVSEKVATPTSVILMWINAWVGFYWRHLIMMDISPLAWEYFSISVPVVVTCSPIGALVASILHRQVLAGFIYILETLSVIGFLLTRPEPILLVFGLFIIFAGTIFFMLLSHIGKMLSGKVEASSLSAQTSSYTSRMTTNSFE